MKIFTYCLVLYTLFMVAFIVLAPLFLAVVAGEWLWIAVYPYMYIYFKWIC